MCLWIRGRGHVPSVRTVVQVVPCPQLRDPWLPVLWCCCCPVPRILSLPYLSQLGGVSNSLKWSVKFHTNKRSESGSAFQEHLCHREYVVTELKSTKKATINFLLIWIYWRNHRQHCYVEWDMSVLVINYTAVNMNATSLLSLSFFPLNPSSIDYTSILCHPFL